MLVIEVVMISVLVILVILVAAMTIVGRMRAAERGSRRGKLPHDLEVLRASEISGP